MIEEQQRQQHERALERMKGEAVCTNANGNGNGNENVNASGNKRNKSNEDGLKSEGPEFSKAIPLELANVFGKRTGSEHLVYLKQIYDDSVKFQVYLINSAFEHKFKTEK